MNKDQLSQRKYEKLKEEEKDILTDLLVRSFQLEDTEYVRTRIEKYCSFFRSFKQNGVIKGGLGIVPSEQWFGGKKIPSAAIILVGVPPHCRGKGIASAMLKAMLIELYEDGYPLSVLYPSTKSLYEKSGYETAGERITYKIESNLIKLTTKASSNTIEVSPWNNPDPKELQSLHTKSISNTNGSLNRCDVFWDRILNPWQKKTYTYAFSRQGEKTGYVVFYQFRENPLIVYDYAAPDHETAKELVLFLSRQNTMSPYIIWHGGREDVLAHLTDPGKIDAWLGWMIRIVNARKALEFRGYNPHIEASVDFEVEDPILPYNNGRFNLSVSNGKGFISEGGKGDLKINIRGLAPLYSGYLDPYDIKQIGLLQGNDEILTKAQAIFTGAKPWMTDMF